MQKLEFCTFLPMKTRKKHPQNFLGYFRKIGEVCSDIKININLTFLMFPTYSWYKYCPNIYPASLYYSTKVSSIWHNELAPKAWIFRRFFSCNKRELLLRIRNNLDLDTQTWFFDSFSKSRLLESDLCISSHFRPLWFDRKIKVGVNDFVD